MKSTIQRAWGTPMDWKPHLVFFISNLRPLPCSSPKLPHWVLRNAQLQVLQVWVPANGATIKEFHGNYNGITWEYINQQPDVWVCLIFLGGCPQMAV